jgi:hypothetical protein
MQNSKLMESSNKKRMVSGAVSALIAGCLALGTSPAAGAQDLTPAKVLPPTAAGDWVRTDTNGSGSFDGLTKNFAKAELTPEGKALLARMGNRGGAPPAPADESKKHGVGEPVIVRSNVCGFNGGQLRLEYDSEGFHMIISKDEATAVQERGGVRNIFLDGRSLPNAATRTPSGSGFSVGHVEPDGTLVVETSDMTPGVVTAGGIRTPETHLTQRYIPSADGQHLKIVFTWEDAKLYAKPHTYEYTFDRDPEGSYALDDFCDATDPKEGQSIVPPPQK